MLNLTPAERHAAARSATLRADELVSTAATFADATDRLEEALAAGVPIAALLAAQADRLGLR